MGDRRRTVRTDGIARELGEAARLAGELLTGAFPGFVYGGAVRGVPVFTFHQADPQAFEQQLAFLRRNGYRTLTTDAYYEIVTGRSAGGGKAVLLTFDDGWSSVWSVALPLLKRYDARVALFLAAGRIRDGGLGPTLADVEQGRGTLEQLRARERSPEPFLTWDEARALHASGRVDLQSHSLTHALVFCSERIVDFVRPQLAARLSATQMPEWTPQTRGRCGWGRPLYEAAPRLSGCRRYLEDPELARACEAYVAARGGAAFFESADWRQRLEEVAASFRRAHPDGGRYETDAEREAAWWQELHESKRLIESQVPGAVVRHFVFPWDRAGRETLALAAKAGYATAFVADVSRRRMAVRLGTPTLISRLGADWVQALPGQGRRSALHPLGVKTVRALRRLRRRAAPPAAASRPLRALLVNRNCAPSVGGIQTFLDTLGRWLAARGVEVTVAATRMPRTTPPVQAPYAVVYGPGLGEALRLLRAADVVQFSVFDYRWWALAKLLRKRTIFIYHAPSRICPKGIGWNGREQCTFDTHWRQCPGCLRGGRRSWPAVWGMIASFVIKRAWVNTTTAAVNISRYAEQRFRVPRSVTIPHGSRLEPFVPAPAPRRDYWLYVGRLVPEKGCDVLLAALARVVQQGHRTPLVLLGDGPERQRLEQLAAALGVEALVQFAGQVTGQGLVERLQHALAVIIPSVWPETWGRVAVEAMSCGAPVIASASGGLQETAGVAGLTFRIGDSEALAQQMVRLAQDRPLQERLRTQGREFSQQFSADRMASQYLALYQRLTNGHRP
jgi:glycosyltransferase involved in cell wall biosynthesis